MLYFIIDILQQYWALFYSSTAKIMLPTGRQENKIIDTYFPYMAQNKLQLDNRKQRETKKRKRNKIAIPFELKVLYCI